MKQDRPVLRQNEKQRDEQVLGAVPLAIATGAGAESRQPIGWVIVGGLVFALFVIPAAYTLLVAKRRRIEEEPVPAALEHAPVPK